MAQQKNKSDFIVEINRGLARYGLALPDEIQLYRTQTVSILANSLHFFGIEDFKMCCGAFNVELVNTRTQDEEIAALR